MDPHGKLTTNRRRRQIIEDPDQSRRKPSVDQGGPTLRRDERRLAELPGRHVMSERREPCRRRRPPGEYLRGPVVKPMELLRGEAPNYRLPDKIMNAQTPIMRLAKKASAQQSRRRRPQPLPGGGGLQERGPAEGPGGRPAEAGH